jgi:hypothetical protein
MTDHLRRMLRAVSDDSELLQQLLEDPCATAKRFDLSDEELAHLQRSTVLLALSRNPLDELEDAITLPPITITASPPFTMTTTPITITGDAAAPRSLENLPRDRLVKLVKRILVDDDYAARVRAFLAL